MARPIGTLKYKEPRVLINIYINEEILKKVNEKAMKEGITRTELLNSIIEKEINQG